MDQSRKVHIRDLIDRLARINAADEWSGEINPTQWTALSYLTKANRFSRSPSQVAEFMAVTRGTVSQTLKALSRKGLVDEVRSQTDKRWISYEVTPTGHAALERTTTMGDALSRMKDHQIGTLAKGLEQLARNALKARGKRAFGICKSCKYHQSRPNGGYCALLLEELSEPEVEQLCYEHVEAA